MSTSVTPRLAQDLGDSQHETFDATLNTPSRRTQVRIGLPPTTKNRRTGLGAWFVTWSWTFYFMGQPRRLSLKVPPVWRMINLFSPRGPDYYNLRNGGWVWTMKAFGKDIFTVFMPALLLWTLITYWTLV